MRFDFQGKHVVVTGGNKGLGLGVVGGYLSQGARVTIVGLEGDVPRVAADLADQYSASVTGFTCDIADLAAVQDLATQIAPLDVLINNAGLELITPIDDPDPAVDVTFRRITEINVIGTFSVTRALLPKLS
ncbi:MAG: SDR family NAD(P)-dependent oxidoreductase, partial [Pseudomonadota bacterium]